MKKGKIKLSIIIFISFLFAFVPKTSNAEERKDILFISSYSPKFISFNDQLEGMAKSLDERYDVTIEYLDVKKFRGEDFEENFYNYLKLKFENYGKFDAVILGDDAALNFALKYRDSLFKDMPAVFFGATDENNIKLAKQKNISGVIEYASIYETVDFIGKIYGGHKNIILLTGDSLVYNKEIKDFYKLKDKYKNFDFINISIPNKVNDSFLDKLSKIDSINDVVLFVYPYRDSIQSPLSVNEAIEVVKNNISAPVFTTLNYDIMDNVVKGTNIIGGKVINHKNQALLASNLLNNMLTNNTNECKIISPKESNLWMFNYNNLKRNNIFEGNIPSDSIVLNKPIPFWSKYKDLLYPVIFVFAGLILILLALISHTFKTVKHKNELRKAMRIAEDANIAKSNFIATISHELRTPVAVITSANQLLRILLTKNDLHNQIPCKTMESIDSNLDIINQNSNRLLRLINNVIDVAKIDSGFVYLKLQKINIINLVEESVLSVIPYANSKELDIVFDTNTEELEMVVDPEKIERIVLNLLSNAIKFSKPKGVILATIIADEQYFEFRVDDNGIGIEEENLIKIFDKFMQIDNGLTRQNEGSGIGLSIVQSFVKLHEGTIDVKSEVNIGTSFIIKLPVNSDLSTKSYRDIPSLDRNTDIELSDIFK